MMVQIAKIKITNRIRKEITKIAELSEDIRINGLINPITVMSLDGGEYQLLAGLRRLKAVELLGDSEIEVCVISISDAEEQLRIEISENEQREPFTFSEKMHYGQLMEAIEQAKAKERMALGGKGGIVQEGKDGRPYLEGKQCRDAIGEKIGMSGRQYDRAKHIAENASDKVIEELDSGKRSISKTYEELKAKEKATKSEIGDSSDDNFEDAVSDEPEADNTEAMPEALIPDVAEKSNDKAKPSAALYPAGLLSKADEEAIERNKKFNAMSDTEKVEELQRQLKAERTRAATAESELARLKEHHQNLIYHKDGAIANLQARLDTAEAKVEELQTLCGIPADE